MPTDTSSEAATNTARAVKDAFGAYQAEFRRITRKAKGRFEQADWHQAHADADERLDLYKSFVDRTVVEINHSLGAGPRDAAFWADVKARYTAAIAVRPDWDVAESFYNSVIMRVVTAVGLDAAIEYVGSEFQPPAPAPDDNVYQTYPYGGSTAALLRALLLDCRFATPYHDLDGDAALAAARVDAHLEALDPPRAIAAVEAVRAVFYRGKGAFLVGRICTAAGYVPLALALLNDGGGITVDAVLLVEDEVSIIFSFARSYFQVEIDKPYALVHFLKSIMPLKPVSELYISLGYNKHGKTELFRALLAHLAYSPDQFQIAEGARGMVMIVFTLPSYDVVFKIIKDTFDAPKITDRHRVLNRYQLVFKHDRGGRLVDAQEFEHLRFDKARFAPDLLEELLRVAAGSVTVEGDTVVIKHLYTERRLTPLDLYIRTAPQETAADVVVDYGQAIKDLAATNIFPGDILLKNFGVTRHGRIVFYDYDELCLLTDCNFRVMPLTADGDAAEGEGPAFYVGEDDVFPEELSTFLGLPPPLRAVFTAAHGDLFDVAFWTALQARHRAREVIDIFPYRESRWLRREGPA